MFCSIGIVTMDEVTESAKSVQEVAKTTGQVINVVDRLGSFFAKVMGEPIETTCDMLADTLKFKRWERQLALLEKAEALINQKGLGSKFRLITPKLALPIFHNASIEDDDTLHDLWSKLLVSSLDPEMNKSRIAFIDIIKQLDPLDVNVLTELHDIYIIEKERMSGLWAKMPTNRYLALSTNTKLYAVPIIGKLSISDQDFWTSVDNLRRLGLCQPYIETDSIETTLHDGKKDRVDVLISHGGYDLLCLTPLGIRFVQVCRYPIITD